MKYRYRYDRLQESLIKQLQKTEAKFRIRADRTIEFAKKWYPDIDYLLNEIRFKIFEKPVIRMWSGEVDISGMLHRLADRNIPFIIENHDGTENIIYDEADVEAFCQIEDELGIWPPRGPNAW